MRVQRYILIMIFCISQLCFACIDGNRKALQQMIESWKGRTIIFPDSIYYSVNGKDSINTMKHANLLDHNYKIFLYVDSIGCTSCKLQLNKWKELFSEANSSFATKVDFIFFTHLQNKWTLLAYLRRYKIQFPIFVDANNKIQQQNNFPDDVRFQCFLLNKNNQVVLIGNPTYNHNLWQLFKQAIENGE